MLKKFSFSLLLFLTLASVQKLYAAIYLICDPTNGNTYYVTTDINGNIQYVYHMGSCNPASGGWVIMLEPNLIEAYVTPDLPTTIRVRDHLYPTNQVSQQALSQAALANVNLAVQQGAPKVIIDMGQLSTTQQQLFNSHL